MSAGATPAAPALSAWSALAWAFRRDLTLAARGKADLALVLIFFVLVSSLFPLGVGPDPGNGGSDVERSRGPRGAGLVYAKRGRLAPPPPPA